MKQRRKRLLSYGLNSLVLTTTITLILALGYLVVDREVGLRLDWTSSGAHTLADKTKDLLKQLADEERQVTVYYFQLPVRGQASRNNFLVNQKVADLASEYQVRSRGNLEFSSKDPYREPLLVQRYNVTPGATVFVDEEKELIQIVAPDQLVVPPRFPRDEPKFRGEEAFTTALQRVLDQSVREVCFVTGHEELPLTGSDGDGLATLKARLERENYQAKAIGLLPRRGPDAPTELVIDVPETCDVVVVARPKKPITGPEVDALLKHFRLGRGLVVLVEPFEARDSGVDVLTRKIGVEVIHGILLDKVAVGSQFRPVPSYLGHPITSRLRAKDTLMVLQGAAGLRPVAAENNDRLTSRVLLQSSDKSLVKQDIRDPNAMESGPFALAMVVGYQVHENDTPFGGRAVVVGDSDIIRNDFMPAGPGNGDFFLNSVHWAMGEEEKITITPKSPDLRALNLSVREGYWVLFGTGFGLPALIGVLGGVIWFRRRSRL